MILSELWDFLIHNVFAGETCGTTGGSIFNPYLDRDQHYDLPGAAELRQQNLCSYLESFSTVPPVLLVGEAPGWRGCRFSGVPFTSEAQLVSGELPFIGRTTSAFPRPLHETSASIFWETLISYHPRFFAWNALPWHPHHPGEPLSNRQPGRQELDAALPILRRICEILKPAQVFAVGQCAAESLSRLDIEAISLRHPARGGSNIFHEQIRSLLEPAPCPN